MKAWFEEIECKLVFRFDPDETSDASMYMQLLFEEVKQNGQKVPDFDDDFFQDFEGTRDLYQVEFDKSFLDVGIKFANELTTKMDADEETLDKIAIMLANAKKWDHSLRTLH